MLRASTTIRQARVDFSANFLGNSVKFDLVALRSNIQGTRTSLERYLIPSNRNVVNPEGQNGFPISRPTWRKILENS